MRRLMAVLLLSTPSAWADRVVLTSGGSISGVVVEKNAERVLLDVGPGRIGIPMARVARIESGSSALASFREQAARIAPGDAEAWAALGYWARERGLETQARQAFEAALQADPSSEAGHRGLGHVRHGELWLTPEESYRARGFVPFEGDWVTPAEREAALQERAASEARAQATREAEARAREAEALAAAAEAEARRREQQWSDESWGIPYWWIVAGGGSCFGAHCGRPPHVDHRPPRRFQPPAPPPEPTPAPAAPPRTTRTSRGSLRGTKP